MKCFCYRLYDIVEMSGYFNLSIGGVGVCLVCDIILTVL
jgi:hypothetical protein